MLLAALLTACGPVVNEPPDQAAAAPPAQEKEEDNVTDYDFSALRACLKSLKTPFGGSFPAMLRCDLLK